MNKLYLEGVIWKNRFFLIKRLKAFYSSIEVKKMELELLTYTMLF